MPGVQVKAVERWLEDGWSPWRIGHNRLQTELRARTGELDDARQALQRAEVGLASARPEAQGIPADPSAVTSGLEVSIEDENPTAVPGVGLILEIEYSVTNHDPVPHQLTSRLEAGALYFSPTADPDSEHVRFIQTYGAISQRRERDRLPRRVRPGETVHGVYVTEFAWNPNPSRRLPDYKLLISDGRREYEARPIGADRDGTPR